MRSVQYAVVCAQVAPALLVQLPWERPSSWGQDGTWLITIQCSRSSFHASNYKCLSLSHDVLQL